MDAYPPEFDGPDRCLVCGGDVSGRVDYCTCPECPEGCDKGDPDCTHVDRPERAHTLEDLANHLGASHPTAESIARRLYKDTRCGIGFEANEEGVSVAGYAEGVDAECPDHNLAWPFELSEFDRAVAIADDEGCEMFDDAAAREGGDGA